MMSCFCTFGGTSLVAAGLLLTLEAYSGNEVKTASHCQVLMHTESCLSASCPLSV